MNVTASYTTKKTTLPDSSFYGSFTLAPVCLNTAMLTHFNFIQVYFPALPVSTEYNFDTAAVFSLNVSSSSTEHWGYLS